MGGNAIPQSERMNIHTYVNLYTQVDYLLSVHYSNTVTYLPRGIREKSSHGDIDILVNYPTKYISKNVIKDIFDCDFVHVNDKTYSFGYELNGSVYQVDLVFLKSQSLNWNMFKTFFDIGDLGNLMGKTAYWHDLSYGYQGLRYKVYTENKDQKLGKKVLISDNPRNVFEILGYDIERFREGFQTYEDVFEYVRSSPYVTHKTFLPSSLNASQRHRDAKRDMYAKFLSYLETVDDLSDSYIDVDMKERIQQITGVDLDSIIQERRDFHKLHKKASRIFNGRTVMNHDPSIKGKRLGKGMSLFRDHFESDEKRIKWIIKHGEDKAFELFMNLFNNQNL